jgi:hypothetical protein
MKTAHRDSGRMGWWWRRGGSLVSLTVAIHLLTVGVAQAAAVKAFVDYCRWRNDDGGETGATWIASTNAPCLGYTGGVIRVRFSLRSQNYTEDTRWQLLCTTTRVPIGLDYYTVPSIATTQSFEMAASPWFSNGDRTTSQLPSGYAGAQWTPGYMVEAPTNCTGPMAFTGEGAMRYSNIEFCIRATSNALPGTAYYFMPFSDAVFPSFTESAGVAELRTFDFRADVNKDGVVNAEDLNIVVTNFGTRLSLAAP